jgi:hypothetical protein
MHSASDQESEANKSPQPGMSFSGGPSGTHIFAPVVRNRKGETTVKLHVNGTNNSRRFIHVYLWWARLLGPNYPISDDMLQGRVWKHLRCTCGEGILDTRGHRRPADPHRVCIGPSHYRLSSSTDLLQIVTADLHDLITTYSGHTSVHAIDAFLANARAFLATNPTLDQLASFLRRECMFHRSLSSLAWLVRVVVCAMNSGRLSGPFCTTTLD